MESGSNVKLAAETMIRIIHELNCPSVERTDEFADKYLAELCARYYK